MGIVPKGTRNFFIWVESIQSMKEGVIELERVC